MAPAFSYGSVRKRDAGGEFRCYFPLRAVGLAVESGYKLCHEGALGLVEEGHLRQVRVSGRQGQVQVLVGKAWKATLTATLSLRAQDAALALLLLKKQRALLSEVNLNWFCTDSQLSGKKSLDLVGDFSTKRNFGVLGKVWVEVKVFGKLSFEDSAEEARTTLRAEFATLQKKDPRFGAVLFLAAECEALGSQWGPPVLKAELLTSVGGQWLNLTGKRRKARGQAKGKPTFLKLWTTLQKHTTSGDGKKVRLLKHFLDLLRLPSADPGKKKKTYNELLRSAKRSERLETKKVVELAGRDPVVGTKETFQELYKLL